MSADPFLDLTRSLAAERRQPVQPEVTSKNTQQLEDLQAVIHLLAQMMNHGKAVS